MSVTYLASSPDIRMVGEEALCSISQVYSELYLPFSAEVELTLVDEGDIRTLNRDYRNLDQPTDVLSFPTYMPEELATQTPQPNEPLLLGSIIICPTVALHYKESLPQLVHHGMLHLIGYDHETDQAAWDAAERPALERLAAHGLTIIPLGDEQV